VLSARGFFVVTARIFFVVFTRSAATKQSTHRRQIAAPFGCHAFGSQLRLTAMTVLKMTALSISHMPIV